MRVNVFISNKNFFLKKDIKSPMNLTLVDFLEFIKIQYIYVLFIMRIKCKQRIIIMRLIFDYVVCFLSRKG